MRQRQHSGQYPKFGGLVTELEEKYIEALGDISLRSRRRLKELQQLLLEVAAAIREVIGE